MSVAENLNILKERVREAAERVGRKPQEIEIVAVTKQVPVPRIREAVDLGLTSIGENRAQELLEKFKELGQETAGTRISWHFVGHLQTNKVKQIIHFTDLIHSLDRLNLAEEIDKRAQQIGKIQSVLVQVNVAGEKGKFGIFPADVVSFIGEVKRFSSLKIEGLMTMAPFFTEKELARPIFRKLRELFEKLKQQYPDLPLRYLSMGMTNDFEVAIEEGSNMIRIGTAIFGRRESS